MKYDYGKILLTRINDNFISEFEISRASITKTIDNLNHLYWSYKGSGNREFSVRISYAEGNFKRENLWRYIGKWKLVNLLYAFNIYL